MMMMDFAVENYGIQTFRVKIGESNMASLRLFRKLVSLLITYTHTQACASCLQTQQATQHAHAHASTIFCSSLHYISQLRMVTGFR